MQNIEKLQWDTDFFGYSVGKLVLPDIEFHYHLFEEKAEDYQLIYIYSSKKINVPYINLFDQKVTLLHEFSKFSKDFVRDKRISEFGIAKNDFEQLKSLVLQSGVYSRFNKDPNFQNNEYNRLYVEWINKLVNDKSAKIFIYAEDDAIQGFIAIKDIDCKTAEISLVAVSSNYRGKGTGKALINHILSYLRERKCTAVKVVTQNDNLPALNLYVKAGFHIIDTTYIYHYWKK